MEEPRNAEDARNAEDTEENPDAQPRRFRWLPRLLLDLHLYGGLILLGCGLDRHLTGALEIVLGLGLLGLFLLITTRPTLLHGSVSEKEPGKTATTDTNPLGRQMLRRDKA